MTRKCTPLDIYFHMSNHYRKLQSVKSVVDTSPPIGYYQKLQGTRQSRPPSRAEKRREHSSLERPYDRHKLIIKHDCQAKEETPPSRSQSLPPRPPTRRKPSDMPTVRKLSSRAQSSGPGSRKNSAQKSRSARSQHSSKSTPPVFAHFTASIQPHTSQQPDFAKGNQKGITGPTPAPRNAKSKQRDTSYKNSISDHEYLQFSLRITEDIIRNDLYTNKEMRRVFNSHLEANRGRLDMDKMTQQIDNLCKELNIPLNDSQDDDPTTRSHMKAKRNKLSCICTPKSTNVKLKDCECGSTRCLPFECFQHTTTSVEKTDNDLKTFFTASTTSGSSQEIVQVQKIAEDQPYEAPSEVFQGDEVDIFENQNSSPVTPTSLSSQIMYPNELYNQIPYYEEIEPSKNVRHSLGFLQLPLLPSLSRVTEQTEPSTSSETMVAKLQNSVSNIESTSEFDASDVLPVLEVEQIITEPDDVCSLSESMQSKKSIKFSNRTMIRMHSTSQLEGDTGQNILISTQADASNLSIKSGKPEGIKSKIIEQIGSPVESGNVLWVICPYKNSEQSTQGNGLENANSETMIVSTSVKSLPRGESQIKTVCSGPPKYCSQSTDGSTQKTKCEPIKQSVTKAPIPTPRCYDASTSIIVNSASVKGSNNNNNCNHSQNNKECNNCDNKKKSQSQILQYPENIQMRGSNNSNDEEEYILVSGPIYVPKSSIIPMKLEKNQLVPETIKRSIQTFSKDAMVNTDPIKTLPKQTQSSTSSKFKVIKEPSAISFSDSMRSNRSVASNNSAAPRDSPSDYLTYSQIHNGAVNVKHVTSTLSNISTMSGMPPKEVPISETMFTADKVKRSISKPPKSFKHQSCSSATQSYVDQANALIHLNDYDLTPQRDSNKSAYSKSNTIPIVESQKFSYQDKFTVFNKDALLLGDEYEINNDFASNKSSMSSCYDNGLPYAICRFYPNISTQTYSADFLLNPTTPNDIHLEREGSKYSVTDSINKETVLENRKQSILKRSNHSMGKEQIVQDELENEQEQPSIIKEKEQLEFHSYRRSDPQVLDKSVSFCPHVESETLIDLLDMHEETDIFHEEQEDNDNLDSDGNELEEFTKQVEENEPEIEINVDKHDSTEVNDDDPIESQIEAEMLELDELEKPSYAHRASIMQTIKQVTTDLEKFRTTEIPLEDFVQTHYNIPMQNRTLNVADDLVEQQAQSIAKQQRSISAASNRTTNYIGSDSKLPFIEVTNSETKLDLKPENSNEFDTVSCCGLKKIKRARRDIIKLDRSSHKVPNISIIPDDQLFEMQPRRTSNESGYGNGRKSLRFDYSAMKEFSEDPDNPEIYQTSMLDIKDFTSSYSTGQSIANLDIEASDLDSAAPPVVRNTLVSYGTHPSLEPSKSESGTSVGQFNETVLSKHNSIVDILLPPQSASLSSIRVLDNVENEIPNSTEDTDGNQS